MTFWEVVDLILIVSYVGLSFRALWGCLARQPLDASTIWLAASVAFTNAASRLLR